MSIHPDKHRALSLYFLFIALWWTSSCSTPQERKEEPVSNSTERFEIKQLNHCIADLLDNSPDSRTFVQKLRFGDTLSYFYSERSFKSLWIEDVLQGRHEVFGTLADARFEGLDPGFYLADSLRKIAGEMAASHSFDYPRLAQLELLISDNLLSFHRDRILGRTEPDSVFKNAYLLPRRKYPEFELFQVLDRKDFHKVLKYNTHREEAYARYMDLLRSYYNLLDSGETWFAVDTVGIRKIEPGDSTHIMPAVMHKLRVMGMATEEQQELADSSHYNRRLAPVIESVQEQFGLFADGVIGRKTLELINTSLEERITQIAATMERLRWFEIPVEPPYILVNLPAYELELHREDSLLSMRVCIGKARPYGYDKAWLKYLESGNWMDKPRDFETPQVASAIYYMVINPTWTVPNSIVAREMFQEMKRDSLYLRKNGYQIFYKGKGLNPDTIRWSKFKADKLPFTFVQSAGEENALGKIKFIFPNPFHIYLHDTPQRSKFKWTERAVSHGCVRVEQPIEFGEFLMLNHNKYNPDDFRILMGYEPRDEERLKSYDPSDTTAEIQPLKGTHILRLSRPVPVFFLYNTVWFDPDGLPRFRRDVYDKNKLIIQAMAR